MANLNERARRINDMRLAVNGDHEAVTAEFERINFAMEQLNPRQMTETEQKAAIESMREVFE